MSGFGFGAPSTTATSFSFGSNTTTASAAPSFGFGSATASSSATPLQFGAPASSTGTTFGAVGSPGSFSFGATGGLSQGTPGAQSTIFKPGGLTFGTPATTQQPTLTFGSPASTGLSFGSTPSTTQQSLTFGGVPATTQQTFALGGTNTQPTLSFGGPPSSTQQPLSFGATPATTQQTLTFGGNVATSQPTLSFGSTPAATQPTLSFGLTPATSQQTLTFGATTATTQPSFGGTPGTTQQPNVAFGGTLGTAPQALTFGGTPATTQQSFTLGSTPATTQPTLSFGSVPTTQSGLTFGGTTTTSQPVSLGLSTPATTTNITAATTSGLSFGLPGQATTKPTLTFGPTATTTTTAASLFNVSAPKTTTSTGFSLSVSTGISGTTSSLFAAPTTSGTTTAAALPAFKGLGGVDPSTTQGTGQKDIKSVKENVVNPEIMQTIDPFKNFVKQQKNLSCEVSRAPVKPLHKVTEDSEALRQLLTSVSCTLQKNRSVANKLKADTSKCLALCEMAQRTHDTPPGLQNDNLAPLEFFIQLVSKFERDIQALRQEIDNTEKHVNSLHYPAILTPQELSVALRRLHDSFVALAGRLQTTHAGVIAQKQRHLSLRRHCLHDTTNIFTDASTSPASTVTPVKKLYNTLPMPGPTPFSSMGGVSNIPLMAAQDKPMTFSTGSTSLPGWGSSNMSGTTLASSLLQSPNSSMLCSLQPVDNQSFQLGKPPPGNKRGKR